MTSVLLRWRGLWAFWASLPLLHARAEPPDPSRELELIESTERNEDPLGLDESTGLELERAAARLPRPRASLPGASQGAAFSAIDGVREEQHALSLALDQGLAFATATLRFRSHAKHAAELAYRFALPEGAVVLGVRACGVGGCADAAPHAEPDLASYERALDDPARAANLARATERARSAGSQTEPSARSPSPRTLAAPAPPALLAAAIQDANGRALALRAGPIAANGSLELTLEYVAPAPVRGGRARLSLPARGYDPNLAPTDLTLTSNQLELESPAEARALDPWRSLEIRGRLRPGARARDTRQRCGGAPCARSWRASSVGVPSARATWLWIDASPSMEGAARGRAGAALAALLAALPAETELRAWAFAARARELGSFRADSAPLSELADGTMLELDAASRPSSAWALSQRELARSKPRVVLISDGQLDPRPEERRALLAARAAGAELWLIALDERAPTFADVFERSGGIVQLPALAEAALQSGELTALADALKVVASERGPEGLRAGEQRVREQAPKAAWALSARGPWLAFWLARERPAPGWLAAQPASAGGKPARPQAQARGSLLAPNASTQGSTALTALPPIRAIPYRAAEPPRPVEDTGLPKESVLSMLRTQLVPQARACLRTDRKGRGDYAVALTFRALFARREVFEARVEGAIPGPLEACLEALLPKLRVPAFSGRIRVSYPIYTEREPPPPLIELEPELADQLQRALRPTSSGRP